MSTFEFITIISLTLSIASLGYAYYVSRQLRVHESKISDQDSSKTTGEQLESVSLDIHTVKDRIKALETSSEEITKLAHASIQKLGLVRFNPYRDTGGDQSFVLSLLDNYDSGVVLTAIHGREGTRVYTKPVVYGVSEHKLSKEETESLKAALKSKRGKQS